MFKSSKRFWGGVLRKRFSEEEFQENSICVKWLNPAEKLLLSINCRSIWIMLEWGLGCLALICTRNAPERFTGPAVFPTQGGDVLFGNVLVACASKLLTCSQHWTNPQACDAQGLAVFCRGRPSCSPVLPATSDPCVALLLLTETLNFKSFSSLAES